MAILTRFSSTELLKLPDCGGLLENGKCRWLNIQMCTGADCSSFQRRSSRLKANERLCSLDEATQERISQKYYNGFRPWLDEGVKTRR